MGCSVESIHYMHLFTIALLPSWFSGMIGGFCSLGFKSVGFLCNSYMHSYSSHSRNHQK